ncbi:ADP-ribosylation factor-like protein 4C [Saccoglossus kowalevskii]|uniref:ADP-ribosylation factor-like protein 4C-like n=1 Tax=Saccoglossus kowalevskii TaxID=10224 RepID=A0ABM0LW47_SACKO|nr:PREDICTED: ADP-ribosylation factor-like protein 4C-like [Saccoglossus kowalevskii]
MGSGSSRTRRSLLEHIPAFQSLQIVMLGLDDSGKTTALYRLKFNEFINSVPTIGFNVEKVKPSSGKAKGTNFTFWDVGGQDKIRPLWKSYTRGAEGIVFIVDSSDVDKLEEAKVELTKIIKMQDNQATPLLVIGNKQDLPAALSVSELEARLALPDIVGHMQLWHLQPACAITGEGLFEGLDILYEMIIKKKKSLKHQKKKR